MYNSTETQVIYVIKYSLTVSICKNGFYIIAQGHTFVVTNAIVYELKPSNYIFNTVSSSSFKLTNILLIAIHFLSHYDLLKFNFFKKMLINNEQY